MRGSSRCWAAGNLMDPGSASSIGKLAALVGKPLYVLARHQFDRRGAKTIAAADPVTIEKEIAEAIAVLRRGGESLSGSAWNYIKSVLSDRPAIFDTQEAQDWLALDDVQSLLRRATEALIAGRDLAEFESEGRRLYSISAEEADWWGGLLFDYAVSFIALTLRTRASFDARLQMVAANERDAVILEDLRELKAASLSQTEILENLATNGRGAPVDIIDRYLADEIARRDSLRAIVAVNSISDVDTLGERVRSGDLAGASSAARINTYRFVAAMHARDGTPNAAEAWLNAAFAEGTNDLAPDYARIALSKREFGQAISYLNGRTDALSNSLRLDIIQQRDGAAAAIEYFETYSAPGQVTGFLLASLANWLADERGVAAGEALLAASTEEQLLENRTLRFHRLRFRLALCVPLGEQARVIAEYGMLPPPGSLRDDAEGQRLKALALEDARQLLADIERDAPEGFVELVQLTTNYLALISPDQAVREAALESVKQLLAVPETRVVFAPLSMIFDIDFDRQALAAQLDQTARLTGWNDAELRAAFDLAVLCASANF